MPGLTQDWAWLCGSPAWGYPRCICLGLSQWNTPSGASTVSRGEKPACLRSSLAQPAFLYTPGPPAQGWHCPQASGQRHFLRSPSSQMSACLGQELNVPEVPRAHSTVVWTVSPASYVFMLSTVLQLVLTSPGLGPPHFLLFLWPEPETFFLLTANHMIRRFHHQPCELPDVCCHFLNIPNSQCSVCDRLPA